MQAGRKNEITSLVGIRGIAALSVVTYHAGGIAGENGIPIYVRGAWAVDLFFVLSGFVIAFRYLRTDPVNWIQFFVARFARIFPLYIFTSVIMLAIVLNATANNPDLHSTVLTASSVTRHLTLTTAMPLLGAGVIWNDPTWSISVEWWVYVLVFWCLAACRTKITPEAGAITGLLMLLGLSLVIYFTKDAHDYTRGWFAFARAVCGFVGGWSAYRLWYHGTLEIRPETTDVLVFISAALMIVIAVVWQTDAWILLPVYPILVLGLSSPGSNAARFLSSSICRRLGEISYSIYLSHPIALWLVARTMTQMDPIANTLFSVTATLALTLLFAESGYRFIELPGRLFFRRTLNYPSTAPLSPLPPQFQVVQPQELNHDPDHTRPASARHGGAV
jgi:peptidoglycan/LPS O-acetylase OafA/YrhL